MENAQGTKKGVTRSELLKRGAAGALAFSGATAIAGSAAAPTATASAGTLHALTPGFAPYAEAVFEEFTKDTGINVTTEPVSLAGLFPKLASIITARDDSYDLIYGFISTNKFIGEAVYRDISKVIPGTLRPLPKQALATQGRFGRVFGIPWNVSSLIMAYRKDLFRQAGARRVAPNWTRFYAQVRKAQAEQPGISGFGIPFGAPFTAYIFFLIFLNGAGALVAKGRRGNRITVNSPAGLAAMEELKRLGDSGILDPASEEWGQVEEPGKKYAAGNLVSHVNFDVFFPGFEDASSSSVVGKTGSSIIPGVQGRRRSGSVNLTDGMNLAQFTKQRSLALEWFKWIARTDTQLKLARNPDIGIYGVSPSVKNRRDIRRANPAIATVQLQQRLGGPAQFPPYITDAQPAIQSAILGVVGGKTSPARGLREVRNALRKARDA